jgi:hypothetical protein
MNKVAKIVLFPTVALLVACDPGMTIRQVQSRTSSTSHEQLVIEVSPVNEFMHSRFYGTKTKLTNISNSSIVITGCQLVDRNTAYQSRLGGGESYPIELAPGMSKEFGPFFELPGPVREVFKKPSELLVHYSIEGREEIARAILLGGKLH